MSRPLRVLGASAVLATAWAGLVVTATWYGWGRAPLAPPGDAEAFFQAARRTLDERSTGNAFVTLIAGGRTVGEHGVSIGEPVDRDTVFQVASLSKWIAAWGVMTLVEAGRVELDAPVERYLLRWSLPESRFDSEAVTVRRLLSHTAGLTDGLGYQGFEPGQPVQSLVESLERAADPAPGASGLVRVGLEPGSRWLYSGGGFTLLQLLVEDVTGESFEAYLQRSVLKPLGMRHSTFAWTPEQGTRLATFYGLDSTPAPHRRFTATAAASLYSTAADLTRFVRAHCADPPAQRPGGGVLPPATLRSMWEPQAWRFGVGIWGLGTILYAPNGHGGHVIGHDGNNAPAINTSARVDPASCDGIVVLATGDPLLATRLAGEWTLWQTGHPGILDIVMRAPSLLGTVLAGWGAIALTTIAAAVWLRR